MSTELTYLVWVTAFTMLLWVPYVLNRLGVRGLTDTVGYPEDPAPHAPWAERLMKAHGNAVENLVVFAALILAAEVAGATNETTAIAAVLYFWARVVHAVVYTLGIPWLRTLSFAAGFVAQAMVAWHLLAG